MSYTIHKSDGTVVTVADNNADLSYYTGSLPPAIGTGTALIGRNYINYGAPIAQNFLQLTENFSSLTIPDDAKALQGQLWFNKASGTNGSLYVRVSSATTGGITNWNKIVAEDSNGNVVISGTVTASSFIGGGPSVNTPVINPAVGTQKVGDIQVIGSVISIYAAGAWQQVFPAVYS